MTIDKEVNECMPPTEVTEEMKIRWAEQARESINRLNKECLTKYGITLREYTKNDFPPGVDPDDAHRYVIKLPA